MAGEQQMRRSSSCRGVSFEIDRSIASRPPPAVTVTSHFCDIDIQEGEDYENLPPYDIEDPLAVLYRRWSHFLGMRGNEEHKQQPRLPPAKQTSAEKPPESHLSVILLDHEGFFSVYKRLFALCLALNLLGLLAADSGYFPYAKEKAALFSIGNILASLLCRSEAFLRCVFWLAVKFLGRWSWVPVRLKTAVTSFLQCLGGIHSSCGVSSIVWLVYSLLQTFSHRESSSNEIIGVASTILGLLLISSLAAVPLVRHLHRNVFERFHRFVGWAALAMLWVFVILTASYNPLDRSYNVRGSSLAKKQEFWFTVVITLLIIFPWVCLRRVPVKASAPSNHAILIKFQGGIESGMMGRISRSPLSEWHTFGIISNGKEEHMILAGAVGDFTRELVLDPPTHLWVRSLRFAGLPYLINMYKRVVVVATGSGICVFLSFLLQPCPANVYVIWVARGIEKNFGDEIVTKMKNYPSNKIIIHDTAVSGRPNVPEMTVEAVRRWGAEVVIVTSNPRGSRDVVNGCKAAGIPAFGPIWDS